jgi:hypothetical protein
VLAGFGACYLADRFKQQRFAQLLQAALVVVAVGSPLSALYQLLSNTPRIDTELLAAIQAIRAHADAPVPTVLTDAQTGELLPGLACCRVYCGNWALTDEFRAKDHTLREMGLLPYTGVSSPATAGLPPIAPSGAATRAARDLVEQVERGTFQYLLIREDSPLLARLAADWGDCLVYEGQRYRAAKLDARLHRAVEHLVKATLLDTTAQSPSRQPAAQRAEAGLRRTGRPLG